MSHENIVGFAPSLVDIHANVPNPTLQQVLARLEAQPGDWVALSHDSDVADLTNLVTDGMDVATAAQSRPEDLRLQVGSSILNILGAMPMDLRSRSTLATSYATHRGLPDSFASLFSKTVAELGIVHHRQAIEGYNPVGFVFTSSDVREKTMAMYPGVAHKLAPEDLDLSAAELVVIDAYELRSGKLARYLHNLITEGGHPIALSLGNHTILKGALAQRIRSYLRAKQIAIICGNSNEYGALFPSLDQGEHTKEGFAAHPIRKLAKHALITFGADGLSIHSNSDFVTANGIPIDAKEIRSTAGAGDVTAGTFISGILQNQPLDKVALASAEQGARALKISNGLINVNHS